MPVTIDAEKHRSSFPNMPLGSHIRFLLCCFPTGAILRAPSGSRRAGAAFFNLTGVVGGSNDPYAAQNNQQQQQQQAQLAPAQGLADRVRNAERVESSIMKLGSLFSQMATLVAEQSETITRVEDDVEAGLTETMEGSKNMQEFYEVTKGNRGLILKVFGLLIFFIFLFLWWT